jgi:hypothetical protein
MHGSFRTPHRRRQSSTRRRSSRRHFKGGQSAAALRAITGARLYLDKSIPTLAGAAVSVGSNIAYVKAAVVLVKSENQILLDRVLEGHVTLLAAAAQVQRVADLVSAYRAASTDDLVALGRTVGAEQLFTNVIEPVI